MKQYLIYLLSTADSVAFVVFVLAALDWIGGSRKRARISFWVMVVSAAVFLLIPPSAMLEKLL